MEMKVVTNTCAGDVAQIHADVESFRTINRGERGDGFLRKFHHFVGLIRRSFDDRAQVGIRSNHEVAGSVWKKIQDNEIVQATMEDQTIRILSLILANTEDTGRGCLPD